MQSQTKLDALSDDELWHIANQVVALSGGSLLNVSQHECVTALRASFMAPDSGREYIKVNSHPICHQCSAIHAPGQNTQCTI